MAYVNFANPEINFKRVSGGWVFRAPNPWLLGTAPHYLVSDEQRLEITAALKAMGSIANLVTILATVVIVFVALHWKLEYIVMVSLFVVIVAPLASGVAAFQQHRLKPILGTAPLASERITYAESMRADEDSTTPEQARRRWLASSVMCAIAAILIVLSGLGAAERARTIFYTLLGLYFASQAVRWYRASKRLARQQ